MKNKLRTLFVKKELLLYPVFAFYIPNNNIACDIPALKGAATLDVLVLCINLLSFGYLSPQLICVHSK